MGLGVIYWAPENIAVQGVGSVWENMTLFDETGEALKGLDALKEAGARVQVSTQKDVMSGQSSLSFFPSPFGNVLQLEVTSPRPTTLTLKIYSVLGEDVATYEVALEAGTRRIPLDTSRYPDGLYLYKGYLGEQVITGTLMKL